MKTFTKTFTTNAAPEKVWQALVDPQIIDEWGAGSAKMSDQENFEFELWGGDIYGKNLLVSKNKLLVQEWTAGDWDTPSKVTFSLKEFNGKTKIELIHEHIPDKEYSEIADGWNRYFLGPMIEYLEMTK